MHVRAGVCVCVCVRERERERDRQTHTQTEITKERKKGGSSIIPKDEFY